MAAQPLLQTGPGRYQPDPDFTAGGQSFYTVNQHKLAFIVGLVALLMPLAMFVSTYFDVCFYYSISHFYYSEFMSAVFIGCLVFIGAFLLAYRGENRAESRLATLAGFCALGVALFPTSGRGCDAPSFFGRPFADMTLDAGTGLVTVAPETTPDGFFELFPFAATVHYMSAALLFAFLAYYSFFVFTRVDPHENRTASGALTWRKTARNTIYIASGAVIVAAMVAMAGEAVYAAITGASPPWWDANRMTFVCETAALWAFGISWMVKGRFFGYALLDDDEKRAFGR